MEYTRLITFLGMGPGKSEPFYEPTIYEFQQKKSSLTPLVQRAHCDLFLPQEILVFGTKDVEERWIHSGSAKEKLERDFEFIQIPKGETESELWEIFEKVVQAFNRPIKNSQGQEELPTEILLDVTHGFRTQPMFGMAALNFVLSEWSRRGLTENQVPGVRVLYGAFEARNFNTNVAPVWDLTEFVMAARWNTAIDAFMRYGRADDLNQVCVMDCKRNTAIARQQGRKGHELNEFGYLKNLGRAAQGFADDLATARLRDILTKSSVELLNKMAEPAFEKLLQRLPPLRSTFERLREWVEPLRADAIFSREGLKATVHLVELLSRLGRFAEQAAMIREGLITHFALESGMPVLSNPGPGFSTEGRRSQENLWNQAEANSRGITVTKIVRTEQTQEPVELSPKLLENLRLSTTVVEVRNDIEHAGINEKAINSTSLRQLLERLNKSFRALVLQDSPQAPPA